MSPILTQILYTVAAATVLVVIIEVAIGTLRPPARGAPSMSLGIGILVLAVLFMVADRNPHLLERAENLHDPAQRKLMWRSLCLLGGAFFLLGVLGVRLSRAVEQLTAGVLSGRKQSGHDQELSDARALASSLVRNSISGVMVLKAIRNQHRRVVDFECRLMNQAAEQLLGRSAKTLLGQSLLKHLPCLREKKLLGPAVSVVETKLPFREERRICKDNRDRWYNIAIAGHGDGVVVSFEDVTGRKKSEQQLRHAAEHDALTGLPSRTRLSDRLEQAISRAKRVPDYNFAVLFLDFDRFKIINDSLGHEVGDQLLINIAERLRTNLRDIDTPARLGEGHLPARLGGDEFVILLDGITSVRDAVIVAERLQKALSQPYVLDGHEVISTASIGIVTSDGKYERPDDILRDADTAMYEAKKSGKARHVVFDIGMHSEALQRLQLEKELRVAADRLAFALVYQPIVDLESARLAGFEALLRWPHPDRGVVLPADFIGLAEELGLIVPIGRWVLQQATRQLVAWQKRSGNADLWMSINLSKHQPSRHSRRHPPGAPGDRGRPRIADPGGHREHDHGQDPGAEAGSRRAAAGADPAGHGRFRDRALLAGVPAPRLDAHPQDRPQLHPPGGEPARLRRHRSVRRAARPQPGPEGRGRGDRVAGAAGHAPGPGLQLRAGMAVQPRARGGGGREAARPRAPVPDRGLSVTARGHLGRLSDMVGAML
jgi:diguanylate cyclase (GGDEF)-like protein